MRLAGVVALVVLAAAACTAEPEATPRHQQATSTATATVEPEPTVQPKPTADDVIADPDARLRGLAVSPTDPDVRIARWSSCAGRPSCRPGHSALVVTHDGFVTRHLVDLPAGNVSLHPTTVGPDRFVVLGGFGGWLVEPDGTVTEFRRPSGSRGPLRAGEMVVRALTRPWRWYGLDPATGAQHPLSTPALVEQLSEGSDGVLRGVTSWVDGRELVVSEDRGATWRSSPMPVDGSDLVGLLPSASVVQAAVVCSDGATVCPWLRVLRTADDGLTWTTFDRQDDPRAAVGGGAVLADGRLVVEVTGWLGQRAGKPPTHPTGLFVSSDWTRFRAPRPADRAIQVLTVSVHGQGVTFWATGWEGRFDHVRRTDDGGLTWHVEQAR